MAKLTPDMFRANVAWMKDMSDAEIAKTLHQAAAPDTDYRQFENAFLGESSALQELGRGIKRGVRSVGAAVDFMAGGLASAFGDTEGADQAFRQYDERMAANRREGGRRSFGEIKSLGDAVDFAAGGVGEAVPMLAGGAAGGSARAMATVGALGSAGNAPARVEQLMPDDSTGRKALATGAITAVGGLADAFVPARMLAGAGKGITRDILQAGATNAAQPLVERGVAAALSKDGADAGGRGGLEQVLEEVGGGALTGAVTAGATRPVAAATRVATAPIRAAGGIARDAAQNAFARYRRTDLGEIDLTQQVSAAQKWDNYDQPAVTRRQMPVGDEPLTMAQLADEQLTPREPATFADLAQDRRPGDALEAMRGQLGEDPAPAPRAPEPDVDPFAAMQEAQTSGRGVRRPRNAGPEQAAETIYVDADGRKVPAAVVTADPALVERAAGIQRRARMEQMQPGETPDMFGGPPRRAEVAPPAPEPQAPTTPEGQLPLDPKMLTTGDLLRELQAASVQTKIAAFRKGEPVGGKSQTGIKAILESQDPVAAIREAFNAGAHPKAELLDAWHERLTGRKISEPAAEPAPAPKADEPTAPPAPEATAPATAEMAAKFGAQEVDLPTRAKSAVEALRGMSKRVLDADAQWNLKEDLKDFTAALKKGPAAPGYAEAVASAEKAAKLWRDWEAANPKKSDPAAGFSPSRQEADARAGAPRPEFSQAKTVGDALRIIAKDGSEFERTVVERILPDVDAAPFRVVENGVEVPGGVPLGLQGARGVQLTNKSKGLDGVWVRGASFSAETQGVNNRTVLHEALHQATARKIALGNLRAAEGTPLHAAVSDLYDLTNHVIKSAKADLASGKIPAADRNLFAAAVNDPRELVTYGLTEPTVQAWMKSVPGLQKRSAWSEFVESVRRILGLERAHTSALADLLDITDRIVAAEVPAAARDAESTLVAKGLAHIADPRKQPTPDDRLSSERARRRAEQGNPEALGALATKGVATDIKSEISYALASGKAEGLAKALNLMTTGQIVRTFGDRVRGAAPLYDALQRKFGYEYEAATKAENATKAMLKLDKPARDALADLMFAATEAELHPNKPLKDQRDEPTPGDEQAHKLLAAKYAALPEPAKKVYNEVRDVLDNQFKDVVGALRSLITRVETRPEARAERLAQIDQLIGKVRGPYFPLARFGDYVLVAKDAAADGRTIVQHFENRGDQLRARDQLVREGVDEGRIVLTKKQEQLYQQSVSAPFVDSVRAAIDDSITDTAQRDALKTALDELVIRALPAASGAKSFLRRRNVAGYSTDAARSLADSVTRAGRYVSNLKFTPDLNAAISDLQVFTPGRREQAPVHVVVDGSNVSLHGSNVERLAAADQAHAAGSKDVTSFSTPVDKLGEALAAAGVPEDRIAALTEQATALRDSTLAAADDVVAPEVAAHLMAKVTAMTGPVTESKAFAALGQLAHLKYLGLSPAYWLTNLAQVPTMAFSHLSGRYGVAQTAAALGRAMPSASVAFKLLGQHMATADGQALPIDSLKGLNADERAALRFMADRGQLDITQNSDLAHISRGESSTRRTVVEYITAGAHYTEVFNRIVTGLAAYRLARDQGTPHQAAMRRALQDVEDTQYNYAEYNKPAVMQSRGPIGAPARLVFMFMQYAQNTMYWWGRNVVQAAKADPQAAGEARRALGAAAVSLGVLGGAAGLPLMGTVHMLMNMAMQASTGDPGYDAEAEAEKWLQEMGASPETAKAMLRGVLTTTGVDLSSRVGQGDLLSRFGVTETAARSRELSRDPTQAFLLSLLGPTGSMLSDGARAVDKMAEGDLLKAFELVSPKGLADVARAYGYTAKGLENRSGDILVSAEEFSQADILQRGIGFTPMKTQELQQDRQRVRLVEQRIKNQVNAIERTMARAVLAGDDEGVQESLAALQEFNASVVERYPQYVVEPKQFVSGVERIIERQRLLAITGGMGGTEKARLLASQLNAGQ